jgi:hypothetical protein
MIFGLFAKENPDIFSKINGKVVEKLPIFLGKASFRIGLL